MGLAGGEGAARRWTEPPLQGNHPRPPPLRSRPGSPRSRAAESWDAELDLRSPFLFVNRRRGVSPPDLSATYHVAHSCRPPGRWQRHGGPQPPPPAAGKASSPGRGRRSLLRCCSVAPAVRAAGLSGRGAGAGLSFYLFKLSVCVHTHIFLYGQRRGNPSLHDGRFPSLLSKRAGTASCDVGTATSEPQMMFA